jgi:hypothetical protein
MARSRAPEPKQPDWPPEKTLRVLRQQLEALQLIRGKKFREVENEENEWVQFTGNAIIHGFGENSQNERNFSMACHAGEYSMMGTSEGQLQKNFELRVERFQATLASSIKELEVSLPEAELRGAYDPGDEFAFYVDLKGILVAAASDVFIVDNYLSPEFFELYVTPIQKHVSVRIVTDEIRGNLEAIAKKFATRGKFELKSSKEVHDRHIFVDGRGWMIGQSIKDAARKKPTYMVEIGSMLVAPIQRTYEEIWARATSVVKS